MRAGAHPLAYTTLNEFKVQKVRDQCRDKHLHIARRSTVSSVNCMHYPDVDLHLFRKRTLLCTRSRPSQFRISSLWREREREREREKERGGGGKRLGPLCLASSSVLSMGAVRIRHSVREFATQPIILWILVGGTTKWLPLNFGFNDLMRVGSWFVSGSDLRLFIVVGFSPVVGHYWGEHQRAPPLCVESRICHSRYYNRS